MKINFYTITLFYFGEYLIDYIIRIEDGKFLIILYISQQQKENSFCLICKKNPKRTVWKLVAVELISVV